MSEFSEIQEKLTNFNADKGVDKYTFIVLGSLWAKYLKRGEEFRHKPHAEVIKAALSDILDGKVTQEEILEKSMLGPRITEEEPAKRDEAIIEEVSAEIISEPVAEDNAITTESLD